MRRNNSVVAIHFLTNAICCEKSSDQAKSQPISQAFGKLARNGLFAVANEPGLEACAIERERRNRLIHVQNPAATQQHGVWEQFTTDNMLTRPLPRA
jgi:hypothetical protein